MRLAIVDDESVYRNQIAELIDSICGRSEVSCFLYADGSELIRSFENGFKLDAIFLDIEMKDVDGMTAARKIREYSRDIPIVFIFLLMKHIKYPIKISVALLTIKFWTCLEERMMLMFILHHPLFPIPMYI